MIWYENIQKHLNYLDKKAWHMIVNYPIARVWDTVYDDETPEQKVIREAEEKKKLESNKTFTQEQVNSLLADEKRKHKAQTDKAIADLETLKKQKGLTDEAKKALELQIEDTRNQLLTKEEMAEKEKRKLELDFKTQVEKETKEKDHWRTQYNQSTIKRAISDAAVINEAFSPEQIVKLLNNDAHLVEETKDDGTRTYTPKVKFEGKDKDGKAITLDLPVEEAVKRMKEEPHRFGNLFKSTIAGGLGGSGGNRGSEGPDPGKMSMEQYKEYRDKLKGKVKK